MTPKPRALPEFVRVDRAGQSAVIHPDFEAYMVRALFDGQGAVPSEHRGRGTLQSCETPQGKVLIRPCLRGGLFGGLLGDRYLLLNRPIQELTVHRRIYTLGVPTVLPVAAIWRRTGPIVRGSFATLEVDAEDLLAHLTRQDKPNGASLTACGRAIQAMHAVGILHADLQLKNLLVHGPEAWIIDFDKAQFVTEVGYVHARENFLRLKRSFQKHNIPLLYFDQIRESYVAAGGAEIPRDSRDRPVI